MKPPWVTPACFFQILRTTPHSPNQVLHLKKLSVTHTLLPDGFLTLAETSGACVYVSCGCLFQFITEARVVLRVVATQHDTQESLCPQSPLWDSDLGRALASWSAEGQGITLGCT